MRPLGTIPGSVERLAIIVPVYRGQECLSRLLAEIEPLTSLTRTPKERLFRVTEVVLVHDNGPDDSDLVMQELALRHPFVKLVWLSRNFGQHAALLAGMARTGADWIVTLDEDGQHDPQDIGRMLDVALDDLVSLVYAFPTNEPPHGAFRNACSRLTKRLAASFLSGHRLDWFHSFRLIRGEIGRAASEICTTHVYLDVALSWLVGKSSRCPVRMRSEFRTGSGFTLRTLLSHFWKLVLASGTKPLRFIAAIGLAAILVAIGLTGYALWGKLVWKIQVAGWTSLIIALSVFSGLILFALGVLSEYLAIALTMAMGKPLFLTLSRPARMLDRTEHSDSPERAEWSSAVIPGERR